MGDRMVFEIIGPNDHGQTVPFNHEELEAEPKSGALMFQCCQGRSKRFPRQRLLRWWPR